MAAPIAPIDPGGAHILVVDDEPAVLGFVDQVLRADGYDVAIAKSGAEARRLLASQSFDLLLTDIKMPGITGLDLLDEVRRAGPEMRCIAMTGYASVESAIAALKLGADSYVIKPFQVEEVRIAVRRSLERKRLISENQAYERDLEARVRERARALEEAHHHLERTYDETLRGIAALLEHKESESTGHSTRIADLTARIGRALDLDDRALEDLWRGALLHDIGKFAIPDSILLKRPPLAPNEQRIFNTYCVIGFKAIESIPFLEKPAQLVLHHREHYDGTGYPCGLIGDEIPLGARIFAVASAYHELREGDGSNGLSPIEARAEVTRLAGTALDPRLVERFLEIPEADLT